MHIGRKSRISIWILVAVLVLLVAARAALPWAIKTYANKTLDSIPGYYGHIEDVDVALWRGAYNIQGLELLKRNGNEKEPFFASNEIKIQLDWGALFHGKLKTEIELIKPKLQFVQRETKEASQTSIDQSWQKKVQKLYPFEINEFRIRDGVVRYRDVTSTPKMNIYFHSLDLDADNISNAARSKARLPSTLKLSGNFLKSGTVNASAKMNALSEPLEADLNASIRKLNLSELNDFTKAYAGFDFEKGTVQVTTEIAASKTRYDGYVKTILKGVDVVDFSKERKEGDSVLHLAWEGLVGGVLEIFENQKRDQFAARIPVAGTRKEMEFKSWSAVGSVIKNAFFRALDPKFEDSVSINNASQSATTRSKEETKQDEKKSK